MSTVLICSQTEGGGGGEEEETLKNLYLHF